ncbi:MAG: aconitate hydratase, partial [Thermoanaerobaculia bacterium]
TGKDGQPVYLRDIWPSRREVEETFLKSLHSEMFRQQYSDVFAGDERWNSLDVPEGDTYAWDPVSTYVRQPPYFVDMPAEPAPVQDVHGARVLGVFGDSITTDHISPAGSIKAASPAGKYLVEHGVAPKDFNSYGARRGNHEVMMRGTFANIRIRNRMLDNVEGGYTRYAPTGEQLAIYDAAMKYIQEGVPTVVLAGKEYGTGSSRDWAAKGPLLQGVRAVLAESFERIHRSNLVGMGIAPLEFTGGDNAESLGLTGHEVIDIEGLAAGVESNFADSRDVTVRAKKEDGSVKEFKARVRLDTPQEVQYYRHGGILHYGLRQLVRA